VARVGECAGCGQYGWVQMDCPPQWIADEFGSPGTLRIMFVELHLVLRCVIRSMVFARALSAVTDR